MITEQQIEEWFKQRLPREWAPDTASVLVDREEITVLIDLPAPELPKEKENQQEALNGYLSRWRAETKQARIGIAQEAEPRFERKVAWGVRCGETEARFTRLSVPVMTRLRQPERLVLDTLVASGVARSRADAVSWCVRLVGQHSADWLAELRQAMDQVDKVRESGPAA